MKKAIINILAFLGIISTDEQPHYMYNPTGYNVFWDGEFLSNEKNLLAVSKQYPLLKKSTLYRAFPGDNIDGRTYVKSKYKVVECHK
jgi:hypothetical protein